MDMPIEDTARNELSEEVQAPLDDITALAVGEKIVQVDATLDREWHIYPVLVEFNTVFDPIINWENESAFWHDINKLEEVALMPGFSDTLTAALKLRQATI